MLVNQGSYYFGDFELNLDLRVLALRGERVSLGSKGFAVLTCLVTHAGEVVSKADLFAAAWSESFVEDGTLAQHVFSLRKALGDKAEYIVTVPGQGYRFMGAVRHLAPAPAPRFDDEAIVQETRETTHVVIEEPIAPATAAKPAASLRLPLALAAAAVLALAAAVASFKWPRHAFAQTNVGVVLADFTNNTGDPAFDLTLKRALEIDLEQSPFVEALSDAESAETLKKMGRAAASSMPAEIAREVCQRNNRQVLLTGSISSVGDAYLLTLEATACATGKRLASAKAQAADKGKVLAALDSVADRVRSKLGESANSIQGFDVPIQDAATPSLDALKAYSTGKYLQAQGKPFTESLPLFQRAVELDPNFAQAYTEIALTYYNLGEPRQAAESMRKSFDLSNRMGVKERLTIQAHYYADVENDWPAALRAYEAWAASYPDDWVPWVDAANLYTQSGQFAPSIADAQRALQLKRNVITYNVLGRAYKDTGRFAEAKSLVQQAAREGKDSPATHSFLFEIAFDEGDTAALAREGDWLAAHKDSLHDYYAAEAAAMQGKYRQADGLFRREIAVDRQEGLAELADAVAIEQAEMEREAGRPADAKATLDQLGKQLQGDADFALQRALLPGKLEDTTFAQRYLAAHANDPHPGSGVIHREIPQMRAALATRRGAPREAVAALEPPNTLDWPHVSVLSQRGQAHLQAGQPDLAARDFQFILDHPGSFFAIDRPLAHLGLARSLAAQKNAAGARAEYQSFLAAWKDADPGLPPLVAAKAELARLP